MTDTGWVSINRSITNHWVWDDSFSQGQAWVDLILLANHKSTKIKVKGTLIKIDRGQLAWSEISLSKRWKWSRGKTRRFLDLLQKDGMIDKQSGHLTTIITICKYNDFQNNGQHAVQVSGQVSVQQADKCRYTDNNVNNENNVNNNDAGSESLGETDKKPETKMMDIPEWLDRDIWDEWVMLRKRKKATNTPKALNMQLSKLIDIQNRLGLGNEALQESYSNGWKGVFEPKVTNKTNTTQTHGSRLKAFE